MKNSIKIKLILKIYIIVILNFVLRSNYSQGYTIELLKENYFKQNIFLNQENIDLVGYFYYSGSPILITDLSFLEFNSSIDEKSYIKLFELNLDSSELLEIQTARVTVEGKPFLISDQSLGFKVSDIKLLHQTNEKREFNVLSSLNFCYRFPYICEKKSVGLKNKYAILYSGGINNVNAFRRYWNDIRFAYYTLRNNFGYSDENIIVIYKDGYAEEPGIKVDYPASPSGLTSATNNLKQRMGREDTLFLFVTNHGGGFLSMSGGQLINSPTNKDGLPDERPYDELESNKFDECIFYYGQEGPVNFITDDYFSDLISQIPCNKLIAVFETCFGGGFIYDLKGENNIIVTACNEFELSHSGPYIEYYEYDLFSYFFFEALNNAFPSGRKLEVNPDLNYDNKISIYEAFIYAKARDNKPETPLLEDNGDGIGSKFPSNTLGDGVKAYNLFP